VVAEAQLPRAQHVDDAVAAFLRTGDLGAVNLLEARAEAFVESRTFLQPWYIRTMVGFGAWLASLLLIGFVAGFAIALEGGYAIVGLAFIVAALSVRRSNDNDFLVQGTLAVSLAGQALLAWGIVDALGEHFEVFLMLAIVLNTVLFVVFPDRIHRVLMVLFAATSVTVLLYKWELNAVVAILGPMLTAAVIFLHEKQSVLIAKGYGQYVRPLMNGLMLSAFGVLLLSTVYILPELGTVDPQIYPRPWISTVLFGAMLLYLGTKIGASLTDSISSSSRQAIGLLMVIVIGASWFAPGLVLALIIVMLGAASGHKSFIGAGIAFFAVFLATYFYGIEVTLRTKSITLVATGAAILLARWLILRMTNSSGQGGEQDV
jgi:hypothetical protein